MEVLGSILSFLKPNRRRKAGEKGSSAVVNPVNEQSNKNISSPHIVNNVTTYSYPNTGGLSTTEPSFTMGTEGTEQKENIPIADSFNSGKLKLTLEDRNETTLYEDLVRKVEAKLEVKVDKKLEESINKLEAELEKKLLRKLENKFEDKFEKKRNWDGEWISTSLRDALTLGDRALVVGHQKTGNLLWVARASIQNNLLPGNLNVAAPGAYFSTPGLIHNLKDEHDKVEVFCASSEKVRWEKCRDGLIPPNAVLGGQTSDGEKLYIGRAKKENTLIPGKVYRGILYIPFYGKEVTFSIFEILCLR